MDYDTPENTNNIDVNREIIDRWRRQLAFQENTLLNLALKCVVQNRQHFIDIQQFTRCNPFDKINKSLKLKMIDMLHADIRFTTDSRRTKFVVLLLNRKVKSFSIMPDNPKTELKIWRTLVSKSLRLKQLNYVRPEYLATPLAHVYPFLRHLTHLEQLSVLQLDMTFDDDALCIIATSLVSLRVLQVEIAKSVSSDGISALSVLSDLKEFIFWNKNAPQHEHLAECLQHLPRLQVLGCKVALNAADLNNFAENFTKVVREREWKSPCQLQQVALFDLMEIPSNLSFPQLKVLHLKHLNRSIYSLTSFEQISELSLEIFNGPELISLLDIVGQKLQNLRLRITNMHVHLVDVLGMCPNLEEFHLIPFSAVFITVIIYATKTFLPLPRLCKLNIETKVKSDKSVICELLLVAPNLQSLNLTLVSNQVMDEIVSLLHNGNVLQHLHTCVVSALTALPQSQDAEFDRKERVDYYCASFVQNCPRLRDLKIEDAFYSLHRL